MNKEIETGFMKNGYLKGKDGVYEGYEVEGKLIIKKH